LPKSKTNQPQHLSEPMEARVCALGLKNAGGNVEMSGGVSV